MLMKNLLLLFLLFLSCPGYNSLMAQAIENASSVELRGGKTFSVGDYACVRYRHTTSTSIDVSLAAFINGLRVNGLRYYGYGLDLMGEYYTAVGDNTDHLLELKAGLGLTAQIDNDPWVYKQLPFVRRLNYGVAGELTGEYRLSENFSLSAFAQQKLLFHKNLGRFAFTLGLGIKLNLE